MKAWSAAFFYTTEKIQLRLIYAIMSFINNILIIPAFLTLKSSKNIIILTMIAAIHC